MKVELEMSGRAQRGAEGEIARAFEVHVGQLCKGIAVSFPGPVPARRSPPAALGASEVDLVVLAVGERGVRCRVLGTGEPVTLRPSRSPFFEVEGEILTVRTAKAWHYGRTDYLSGEIVAMRLDIPALGLEPLRLCSQEMWDPARHYWGEPGVPLEKWAKPIFAAGPRPSFEMEQILPGQDPEDIDGDPILEAVDLRGAGDEVGARKILGKLLIEDLRCLDAHAHLGNFEFDRGSDRYSLDLAHHHYEVGVRIGELSLGVDFGGVLAWGHIDNRPFLRCLHGYGMILWRRGDAQGARRVFERMLWLNPSDNQGARFLVAAIDESRRWEDLEEDEA